MKPLVFICLVGVAILSCSKKENTQNTESIPKIETVKNPESSVKPEDQKTPEVTAPTGEKDGKTLIASLDCLTCHKEDAKLIGPSYQEVANKYTEADAEKLADKIINGGSGVWGQVPMAPHAGLSKEDAKKMVEYILSLKK